jgi:hypothetical protein
MRIPPSTQRVNARSSGRWVSLSAILLLAACSSSQTGQLAQQAKIVRSAAATAQMIAEAWLADTIPSRYASRTLESMVETIAGSSSGIENSVGLTSNERASTLALLRDMQEAVKRTHAGIEQQDRSAVRTAASSLARP